MAGAEVDSHFQVIRAFTADPAEDLLPNSFDVRA